LALENRYQFQYWALSLVGARPVAGDEGKPKKGKDRGIDGEISFVDEGADGKKTYYTALIQVKSGKVKSGDVRDFIGTLEREKQPIGLFLTLEAPSADMKNEALSAGVYASPLWGKSYRRVQILTIEDLLGGQTPDLPPQHGTFPHIERAKERAPEQDPLL
jgi:site-specific DNA-methyltransferase (adenine-specific)